MYLPKRALISFASGMAQFFLVFICYISWFFIYSFSLHLPSEIVPATHKKAVRAPCPATVRPGGGVAHIAHHVEETVTDIAVRRKKVHQGSTDHNSLALVGVLLGNSWAVPMQLKMWGVNVIHYCKFLHEFHRGNGNAVICSHDTRKTRSRQLI